MSRELSVRKSAYFICIAAAAMLAFLFFPGVGFSLDPGFEDARKIIGKTDKVTQHSSESYWQRLDDGLHLAEYKSPQKSLIGAYPITVLKIAPNMYSLKLICASEHGGKVKTAKHWADAFGLTATINASMYKEDNLTSTGYMKNFKHVNNGRINSRFGAFMAFNPVSPSLPSIQIIDRYEQDWEGLIKNYNTVIQNYRMISLKGSNVWKKSDSIYSIAAVAMDREDNILFIHSRSPYSVHDFNEALLKLPLEIKNAMYVEGGPEATLYIKARGAERAWAGSYETGFFEHDGNASLWPVPNIIGINRGDRDQGRLYR